MSEVELWGIGTSRTMRVVWTLIELDVSYLWHRIGTRSGETLTKEYTALNPKQKIPTLRHGDLVVSESPAIIQYLSEAFPTPAGFVVPSQPAARARLNEWCCFVAMELDAHALYLIRRHGHLPEIYGAAPEAVASAEDYFRKQVAAVAERVAAANPYLLADGFSIADILLMTCIDWAMLYRIPLPEAYVAYRERVAQRPAFREALERNYPGFVIEDGKVVGAR